MGLLTWIKSTIGLSKAPARSNEAGRHDAGPHEVGSHAVGSHAVAPQASGAQPPSREAEPPVAPPPEPVIESAAATAAIAQHREDTPAPVELDQGADAIKVEPARPIDVKVDVKVDVLATPADAPCAQGEPPHVRPIETEPESPPTREEIDRRRAMVRGFFNDYWSSIEDKPASFAERLDYAESYINERVAAGGEAWRLSAATRKQLGLPPSRG